MAVIKNDTIVSPSVNTITTVSDLDSTTLEPGIYILSVAKTINGFNSSRWTVICLANELASDPVCYSQIWVPAAITGTTPENQNIYVRTIAAGGSGYGAFSTLVNADYLANNACINKSALPVELYVQPTQPPVAQGKNIVWIDTSS